MKGPSLFELSTDLSNLLSIGYPEIYDKDPEDVKEEKQQTIEAFNDTLHMLLEAIDDKADGYCALITRFEGRAKTIEAEISRLMALKKAMDNAKKRMKEAMIFCMNEQGRKEIVTDLHTIKVVNNGGVQPLDVKEDKVPKEYMKTIIEEKPDNDKIREALNNGEHLDFAELKPRGQRLSIK